MRCCFISQSQQILFLKTRKTKKSIIALVLFQSMGIWEEQKIIFRVEFNLRYDVPIIIRSFQGIKHSYQERVTQMPQLISKPFPSFNLIWTCLYSVCFCVGLTAVMQTDIKINEFLLHWARKRTFHTPVARQKKPRQKVDDRYSI